MSSPGSSMPPSPAKGGRKASARATTGASSVNRAQNQKANVTHYGVNPVCRCLNKTAWTEKIEAFKKKPNDPSVEIPLPLKDTGVCFDFAIRPQTPGTYQPFAGKGKDEATAEKEARQAAKKEFQKKSASFAVKGAKALLVQDTGNPSLGRASGYCGFASYTAFITFLWFECPKILGHILPHCLDATHDPPPPKAFYGYLNRELREQKTVLQALQRMQLGEDVKITRSMADALAEKGDEYYPLGMMAAAVFAILMFSTVGPARAPHGYTEAKCFSAEANKLDWGDYESKYESDMAEDDPTRARALLGFKPRDGALQPRFSTVRDVGDDLSTETDILGYSSDDIQRSVWTVNCYIRKRQTPGSFIPQNKPTPKNEKIFYLGDGEEEKIEEQKKADVERQRSRLETYLAAYYGYLKVKPRDEDLVPAIRDKDGKLLTGEDSARFQARLAQSAESRQEWIRAQLNTQPSEVMPVVTKEEWVSISNFVTKHEGMPYMHPQEALDTYSDDVGTFVEASKGVLDLGDSRGSIEQAVADGMGFQHGDGQ